MKRYRQLGCENESPYRAAGTLTPLARDDAEPIHVDAAVIDIANLVYKSKNIEIIIVITSRPEAPNIVSQGPENLPHSS